MHTNYARKKFKILKKIEFYLLVKLGKAHLSLPFSLLSLAIFNASQKASFSLVLQPKLKERDKQKRKPVYPVVDNGPKKTGVTRTK